MPHSRREQRWWPGWPSACLVRCFCRRSMQSRWRGRSRGRCLYYESLTAVTCTPARARAAASDKQQRLAPARACEQAAAAAAVAGPPSSPGVYSLARWAAIVAICGCWKAAGAVGPAFWPLATVSRGEVLAFRAPRHICPVSPAACTHPHPLQHPGTGSGHHVSLPAADPPAAAQRAAQPVPGRLRLLR